VLCYVFVNGCRSKQCKEPGCQTLASYGTDGGKAENCASHKQPGMKSFYNKYVIMLCCTNLHRSLMVVGSSIGTPLPCLPSFMKLIMLAAWDSTLCFVMSLSMGVGQSSAKNLTAKRYPHMAPMGAKPSIVSISLLSLVYKKQTGTVQRLHLPRQANPSL